MSNESLIALGGNLESPRNSKATDWPNIGASGPEGQESGRNQLIKLTDEQESPRRAQDSGDQTPSVWGVKGFEVSKNKGESGSAPSSLSIKGSVNCTTGQMEPEAYKQTY